MKATCSALVAIGIAIAVAPAWAAERPSHANRYEMVEIDGHARYGRIYHGKIVILDKRDGALWSVDKSGLAMYMGQVFPLDLGGSIARIIHIEP